ncbi:ankyrin repeat domain-containing protein [Chromobacterium violaceum]|uniref:ankyrin repeat domain-containing protein n=1 Tax=Chromobacterium violaceum TaxID=536 RepID=UPI0012D47B66|nr:ankyrin repeat domain-containing protein [Chromobacterium violaceum]
MRILWSWIAAGILMTMLHAPAEAGLWGTTCARRSLDEAYRNPQAVALAKAAVRGDAETVAWLAATTPGLVNTLEDGAVPPLLWAICADNVEGFEALLKAGADPNLGGNGHGPGDGKGHGRKENGTIIREGWSAMLLAAGSGNPAFLRLALRYGGDVNAAKGKRVAPNQPLLLAAYYGLFDNVKALVAAGADINARDIESTAPEYAIGVGGRFDIAVWLLQQGFHHDLPSLALGAEIRQVPLNSPLQRSKEQLINMLRAQGLVFPRRPLNLQALKERDIPPEAVEDLIMGRKLVWQFRLKSEPPS